MKKITPQNKFVLNKWTYPQYFKDRDSFEHLERWFAGCLLPVVDGYGDRIAAIESVLHANPQIDLNVLAHKVDVQTIESGNKEQIQFLSLRLQELQQQIYGLNTVVSSHGERQVRRSWRSLNYVACFLSVIAVIVTLCAR